MKGGRLVKRLIVSFLFVLLLFSLYGLYSSYKISKALDAAVLLAPATSSSEGNGEPRCECAVLADTVINTGYGGGDYRASLERGCNLNAQNLCAEHSTCLIKWLPDPPYGYGLPSGYKSSMAGFWEVWNRGYVKEYSCGVVSY